MIYHRIKPEGEFIKAEDYRFGFGIDSSHYNRVRDTRLKLGLPTIKDFTEDYDTRDGFNIAGERFNTRYHPYHDLHLIERKTGKRYIVDSVHKHHYFGYYIMLLIRAEGSNSHGCIYWENISCKDPSVIEGIVDAYDRFEVKK